MARKSFGLRCKILPDSDLSDFNAPWELFLYIFIHTKRATSKYAQRLKKGRATRKGMDEGKGGQTLSQQEREGENRKQSLTGEK